MNQIIILKPDIRCRIQPLSYHFQNSPTTLQKADEMVSLYRNFQLIKKEGLQNHNVIICNLQ